MLPQTPVTLKIPAEPPVQIGLVQGTMPDSVNEWWVAMALDKLDIFYFFQVPIYGGRSVRGGMVIDFVAFVPSATPIFVQGEYWHNERNSPDEQLKIAAAAHWFKTDPILLTEEETSTFDKALQSVKTKVMR